LQNFFSHDWENESLYKVLEQEYNYTIDGAIRTLEARIAEEYEAKLLDIDEGEPIQFIETVTYLDNGTPIEYSLAKYRGDKNTFTFELKKQRA
jgi:GntR family transcriptional regulator